VTIVHPGRAFQAATAYTVAEGIRIMSRGRQTAHSRGYRVFLQRVGKEVRSAAVDNIGDLHVFHVDLLQGVTHDIQRLGPGAHDAQRFMEGFFDGCCQAGTDKPSGLGLLHDLQDYTQRWSAQEPLLVDLLKEAGTFLDEVVEIGRKANYEPDIREVLEAVDLHFRRISHEADHHGVRDSNLVYAVGARLRAFIQGYHATLVFGDAEHAWRDYWIFFGAGGMKESAVGSTMLGLAYRRLAGFLGASKVRGEPCDDLEAYLQRHAVGKEHFELEAPFAPTTAAGERAAVWRKGFLAGLKAAQTVSAAEYPAMLSKAWPFGPADLTPPVGTGGDATFDLLDAYRERFGLAAEPMDSATARKAGWLEAHLLSSIEDEVEPESAP
jgi:hypothetical protein